MVLCFLQTIGCQKDTLGDALKIDLNVTFCIVVVFSWMLFML